MALKRYYVKIDGKTNDDKKRIITNKMKEAGYHLIGRLTLLCNTNLLTYGIKDAGLTFCTKDIKDLEKYQGGNVEMIGTLEEITETKEEVEEKTGFKFQEV